jgi:sugar phosphate isomerase/epimerase
MDLGIFAKTFARDSLEEVLDAVRDHGFTCTQFNMVCAGLASLPDAIDPVVCEHIRNAHTERDLTMAAVSGTFNIIDHDRARLTANLTRLRVLANACPALGTSVVTLCTGTRDRDSMWKYHPENESPAAWTDMVDAMRRIAQVAEDTGITVAIEPEVNNVVDSAAKARRLLDELQTDRAKVIMDGANLFKAGDLSRMHEVLDEAFSLVGHDIVIAHAKDLSRDGDAGHEAAGTGLVDYGHYLGLLRQYGFDGPLITHGLSEEQVPQCYRFLRGKMALQGSGFRVQGSRETC